MHLMLGISKSVVNIGKFDFKRYRHEISCKDFEVLEGLDTISTRAPTSSLEESVVY